MASLMEDLIDTLQQERSLYETLLDLSGNKTQVIVKGDLQELSRITDAEQGIVSKLATLDKKRSTAMKDIAIVLNKDVDHLRLTDLVQMLDKRPDEQRRLAEERDKLKAVADNVKRINGQNAELLNSSLEMVQFEMNILQTSARAPETANYTRAAGTSGDVIGSNQGSFDAKQ